MGTEKWFCMSKIVVSASALALALALAVAVVVLKLFKGQNAFARHQSVLLSQHRLVCGRVKNGPTSLGGWWHQQDWEPKLT